jgi:hypothetical protein
LALDATKGMIMILKLLSKGEKRDKMKRTIQALAMLIAITLLAVWMVGCGGEEAGPAAELESVVPAQGETIAGNTTITIKLTNPVKADTKVQVNGVDATGSGKNWTFTPATPLPEGDATLTITWTNDDDSEGSAAVQYKVTVPDNKAPEVTGSTPKHGDENLDPEKLNEDGMKVEFDEPIKKASIEVTVEGEAIPWLVTLSDDKKSATLEVIKGGELSHETTIVIVVGAEDLAGNKLEGHEITFTTAAKEE